MEAPEEEEEECVGRGEEATTATAGGGRRLGEVGDGDSSGRRREERRRRRHREEEGGEAVATAGGVVDTVDMKTTGKARRRRRVLTEDDGSMEKEEGEDGGSGGGRKKRRQTSDDDCCLVDVGVGVDRLGALPDELLLLIISFLPMDAAVRTTAICRRWRHISSLLPSLPSLSLDPLALGLVHNDNDHDYDHRKERHHEDWVLRADKALASHHALIRRCKIVDRTRTWNTRGDRCISRWLDALARKGIHALTLESCTKIRLPEPFLPRSKSLASLELVGLNLLRRPRQPPIHIACTALRTLKLVRVMLYEDTLRSFLSACVQLDTLHVESCYRLASCRISAAAPANTLKCVRLRPSQDTKVIDVDAPSLRTLSLRIAPWSKSLRLQAPQLNSCQLHVSKQRHMPNHSWIGSKLTGFLSSAIKVDLSELTLGGALIQCLCSDEGLGTFPLPSPIMLKRLSIGVDLNQERQALFMVLLLECCPILRELTITGLGPGEPVTDKFSEHKERLENMPFFEYHLEKVDMLGIMADTYELELVRLILVKAKTLNCIKLQLHKKCSKEKMTSVTQSVVSYHKVSPGAKVIMQILGGNPEA